MGTYQETNSHATHQGTFGQSSQLTEPLWTDPGQKEWNQQCAQANLHFKKKKKKSADGK